MLLLDLRFYKWLPITIRVKPKLCHSFHGPKNVSVFYISELSYSSFIMFQ